MIGESTSKMGMRIRTKKFGLLFGESFYAQGAVKRRRRVKKQLALRAAGYVVGKQETDNPFRRLLGARNSGEIPRAVDDKTPTINCAATRVPHP
jgi:hypothetical protein